MTPSKNTVPVGRPNLERSSLQPADAGDFDLVIQNIDGTRFISPLNKDVMTVGRATDNDVIINDQCVSGHHCELRKFGEKAFELVDLDSYNGTAVNEIRIDRATVKPNDRITIGLVGAVVVPSGKNVEESAKADVEEFRKEQREFAMLSKQLDDRQKQILNREASLKKEEERMKEKRSDLAAEIKRSAKDREGFEGKQRAREEAMAEESERFESRKKRVSEESDELDQKIIEQAETLAKLREDHELASQEFEAKTAELEKLQIDVTEASDALEGLVVEVTAKEANKTELEETIEELNRQIPDLAASSEQLQGQLEALTTELETAQGSLEHVEARAAEAQAICDNAATVESELDRKLNKKKDELAFFENRLALTREERERLEEESREYRIFMDNYERRRTDLEREVEALQARLIS
ncbi:MAG: FHA domain-containing protein [Verrucomicrobiota bacterium]